DADGVDVVARVSGVTSSPTTLENMTCVVIELDAGLTIRRAPNGRTTADGLYGEYCGASATRLIGATGAVSFSASQTNKEVQASLVASSLTTRTYNQTGHHSFRLKSNGTYEVWANAANANKNGSYTTSTVFRMEKTGGAIRWFVDGVRMHETTTNVPATARFDVSFNDSATNGELSALRGIEIETTSLDLPAFRAGAAADGSFRIPLRARAGDAILAKARDRHRNPLESSEVAAGTIPADFTIASVTFSPAEVTGGRTATGTVTLPGPAGPDGVRIDLSSASTVATVPTFLTIAAGQTSGNFNVTTSAVPSPVDVTITATWGAVSQTGTLRVAKDNVAPVVTITSPAANTLYNEGATIPVRVSIVEEDSGVKQVYGTIDGRSANLTREGSTNFWSGNVPGPFVDGTVNVTRELTVTAVDNTDNAGTSAPLPLQIKPNTDVNAPTISWLCGTTGAIYPVGHGAKFRVLAKAANAQNPIQKVEVLITDTAGVTSTYTATAVSGVTDAYEYAHPIPDVADGTVYTVRAIASAISGTTAMVDSSFKVLEATAEITANTTIAANNTTYDDKIVAIKSGTVTIAGPHRFKALLLLGTATLTHAAASGQTVSRIEMTADDVFVECGATFDANGQGYAANTTYPGASLPSAAGAGSHIGYGGRAANINGTVVASTFGSVYSPQEAGGGGENTDFGRAGGGIIQINAGTIVNDGVIRAQGKDDSGGATRGGGGGSIWITATTIGGIGTVDARGGNGYYTGGGGGAVSITYAGLVSGATMPWTLSTKGGIDYENGNPERSAGPGSIYVKGPGA
ncbi:MAG TPA: Ig-like domain-containing protein, partial [Thermoanaerobaculia bacterium]|nr:Ig-like domain-containing protein [Thermoanaerobaculia bacterium]